MKYVYQIHVSNPSKAPEVSGKLFCSIARACAILIDQGFYYSPEAALWHNGSTEAWIMRHPVNTMLSIEGVQLR